MKFHRNIIAIGLLVCAAALGANDHPSCGTLTAEGGEPSRQVTVWNYFGGDFHTAKYFELRWDQNYAYFQSLAGTVRASGEFQSTAATSGLDRGHPWYGPNPAKAEVESGSEGANLLDRNQFFPLLVMERTGYIDTDRRLAQSAVTSILHPDQVLFFEITSINSGAGLIQKYGKIPSNAREEANWRAGVNFYARREGYDQTPDQIRDRMWYQVKQGAAWLLSGQPNHVRRDLYLEPGMTRKIDRKEFPFVWEVGRAAQVDPGKFHDAARVAVFYAARELILLGGKLEEGYIFAHSLNGTIARVYERKYGMKEFSRYNDAPEELSLMATLASQIDKVDIRLVSARVANLVQSSPGLSTFEALKIALYAKQNRNEYVADPAAPDSFVQLRDFTSLPDYLIRKKVGPALAEAAKPDPRPMMEWRDKLGLFAEQTSNPYLLPIDGIPGKSGDNMELDEFLTQHNAIEASSEKEMSGDLMLAAAYWRAIQRLQDVGEPDPAGKLRELGVSFALYNVEASAPPIAHWHIRRERLFTIIASPFFRNQETIRPEISKTAAIYSLESVEPIAHRLKESAVLFARGDAHRQHYLSLPELMKP